MTDKIAILYTTFLRDELVYKTVPSILSNMTDNHLLLIADQGKRTPQKDEFYATLPKEKVVQFYLNYDCGLSFARNFLVIEAYKRKCDFCLLTADSILFTKPIENLEKYIQILKKQKEYGIIGFKLNNRVSWEKLLRKNGANNKFIIKNAFEFCEINNCNLLRCDIVRNFFLTKTSCLLQNPWDNDLKLAEHEIFFWNIKIQTFLKVFYSEDYEADYVTIYNKDYQLMRVRLYKVFVPLMLKKYKLAYWLDEEK